MHFEILVEDQSGKAALDLLVPKVIGDKHSFRVTAYKGIGRIPRGLKTASGADRRILLDQLPRLLRGYGKTFAAYQKDVPAALIVVCDLDDKCLRLFRQELRGLLAKCNPKPLTRFCIAIEEGEAWLLGDLDAVTSAFPTAKQHVLDSYRNDSICGTWEHLANAIYPGGAQKLSKQGWQAVGRMKSQWAERICPHMDVESNASPSFGYFRSMLRGLIETEPQPT